MTSLVAPYSSCRHKNGMVCKNAVCFFSASLLPGKKTFISLVFYVISFECRSIGLRRRPKAQNV